jgi:hypothetical protein
MLVYSDSGFLSFSKERFNYEFTFCLYGAGPNDFDASIHFEGHWKGWALKIEIF